MVPFLALPGMIATLPHGRQRCYAPNRAIGLLRMAVPIQSLLGTISRPNVDSAMTDIVGVVGIIRVARLNDMMHKAPSR